VKGVIVPFFTIFITVSALAQQPPISMFDGLICNDVAQDPDMGKVVESEIILGPLLGLYTEAGYLGVSGVMKWTQHGVAGWRNTVGAAIRVSRNKQTAALSYFRPRAGDSSPWLGLSLSYYHLSVENVLEDTLFPIFETDDPPATPDPYATIDEYYASNRMVPPEYLMSYHVQNLTAGMNVGYVVPLRFGRLRFQAGYNPQLRYILYDPDLHRAFEKTVRDSNQAWTFVDQVSVGIYLDGRDNYRNPSRGFYAGQTVNLAGGFLLGDRDFIRTDSRVEGFLTLLDVPVFESRSLHLVLAAHSALALILPNFMFPDRRWQTNADGTEHLYIDGTTVGRGWDDTSQYGDALWDNKLELRMAVVQNVCWLVSFFDAAALFDEPFNAEPPATSLSTMSIDQFRFSIGLGVRLTFPHVPIRLYLSKGFRITDRQLVWRGGNQLGFVIAPGGDVF
jgi:outer membrane protein assembly factor BamA